MIRYSPRDSQLDYLVSDCIILDQKVVAMCLSLSHSTMKALNLSQSTLGPNNMHIESGEFKWKFQGNLGLIIDLCREFLTLEYGNQYIEN